MALLLQIFYIPTQFDVHSLSIGCCIGATEIGSLVIEDATLLEKSHHTFHETNTSNVFYHGSESVRIVVGSSKLKRASGVFHDEMDGVQYAITVD